MRPVFADRIEFVEFKHLWGQLLTRDLSSRGVVKAMFTPRISLPSLCRGLGGLEGSSQRSLQRNGTIRKTFSGGMAALRRHSQCIAVKLQTVSVRFQAPLPLVKPFMHVLLFLLHHQRTEGRLGEPDPSSQARVPALRPRKDRRRKF